MEDLLKNLGIPIVEIYDQLGLNLIHHAVLKGVEGKIQFLIDFAREQSGIRTYEDGRSEPLGLMDANEIELLKWINAKTFNE